MVDLVPTDAMAAEARRGLDWRKEYNRGGTIIGVTRANQLIRKENLSPSTVRRMHSYFSRHEVDKQGQGFSPGEQGYPSAGRIAWALWGGDPGQSWARSKVNQLNNEDKSLLDDDTLIDEIYELIDEVYNYVELIRDENAKTSKE
ncbi:MAG: Synechococcus phage [Cyanobacteriota bacterium]|jgi:hypothetical protein